MEQGGLSISVRLRRVRTETTQVSVPITEEVTRTNDDGSGSTPDVDKIIEVALRMGQSDSVVWEAEGEPEIRLHPEQAAASREPIQ